jgi:CRISPR/Cas system CMR-associated protein Cmr3 (group 5 of RAMP superfamily)
VIAIVIDLSTSEENCCFKINNFNLEKIEETLKKNNRVEIEMKKYYKNNNDVPANIP